MKLFSTLALPTLLSTAAFAQSVRIGNPPNGTSVHAGSNVLMEIDRPDTLTGSTEIAIIIGFQSCATMPCHAPSDGLGTILYNGGYKPEFQPGSSKPPHQNFTVTIPASAPQGPGLLGVSHVALVGAGQTVILESLGVTVNVN
ncbi:hypothetical protein BDZ94DRAFT_323388 [Collybia nuda]|uniref:Uncharacterized protein n=1 Tax=Collybia nuda TaxID=64659 RepID=A0A9P6CKP4_9AGAR|nr:hypothetical protein BDZ94DRAFT_323388 [Collybia nuda]